MPAGAARSMPVSTREERTASPGAPGREAANGMEMNHKTSAAASAWNTAPRAESSRRAKRWRTPARSWEPAAAPTTLPTATKPTTSSVTMTARAAFEPTLRTASGAAAKPTTSPAATPSAERMAESTPWRQPA